MAREQFGTLGGADSSVVTTTGIRSEYLEGLRSADVWATRIAREVRSERKSEQFAVAGRTAILQKWKDERVPQGVFETSVTITPDHYEATIGIDRNSRADDQVGLYDDLASQLGVEAAEFPNVLLGADLLDAAYSDGAFGLAFDGQFFYDTDHSWPGPATYTTSQDNDLTGAAATGTTPTTEECHTALDAILESFRTFKDDKGRPFHRGPTNPDRAKIILLCPPDMQGPMDQAIGSRLKPAAAGSGGAALDNVNNSTTRWETIGNPYSANNERVQAFLGDGAFLYLVRQEVRFSQVTADGGPELSYEAMMRRFDYFGVDLRAGAGYRMWPDSISYIFS